MPYPGLATKLMLFCAITLPGRAAAQRPNIVVLLADDLGYGELGCQGNTEIPTPHIDSIAAAGVRFTNGYVTAPFCSASRAGLLTGRFQTRFGYEFNPIGHHNEDPTAGLPASETTLAQALHNAGYATGLIGKWHLGGTAAYHPQRRGFDDFFGFLHEGHYFVPYPYESTVTMLRRRTLPNGEKGRWITENLIYSTHMGYNEPAYDANNPILRSGQPVDEQRHLTDAFSEEAVRFIERYRNQPFFLYVAYNAVHSPLQGANSYMKRFATIHDIHRRVFAAMLSHLDDGVGRILKKLADCQIDQHTLVVFLSDNGGPTRELTSSNRPLRGEKGDVLEGGIRVPFMIKWPQRLRGGKTYHAPVCSVDLFPTACAAAEAPLPKKPLDGVNLIPYLTGRTDGAPHDYLFWRVQNRTALRQGNWKLVRNPRRDSSDAWQLYNLADDISESDDLASEHPVKLAEMLNSWKRVNDQMIEPRWRPRRQ